MAQGAMDQVEASLEVISRTYEHVYPYFEGCTKHRLVICATLLFIHDVTEGSSPAPVSTALIEYHAFLEAFADLCFGDVTGMLRDSRVPRTLFLDVQRSLNVFNKALAAHREAWRYVGLASELKRQQTVRRSSTITSDLAGQKKRWREEMRQRSQIWKERAGPDAHSFLFEREEMDSLLEACNAWIDRLRHTLLVIILVGDIHSPHFPTNDQATHLGIAQMLERQRRLGLGPSEIYMPLTGRLRKSIGTSQPHQSLIKTVFNDGSEEMDVMVEIRPYSDTPAASVRQLTWYLSASSQSNAARPRITTHDGYNMLSLSCLGYIDDSSNARCLILFRSPQSHPWASIPPSLHDLIMKGWTAKLSLTQRFKTARTLAASVLDIHTSGSLHSSINSHNIPMMPRQLNDSEPSPFLLGWGVGPTPSNGPMALEPNFYHHQSSFGQSYLPPTTAQDIYSLGVVLLEIGLWTTMSTVFAKLLDTTPRFSAREEKAMFRKVNRVIMELAHGPDLPREMGVSYARVVQRCLVWNVEDVAESMLAFRKDVVDVLNVGCSL